MTGMGVGGCRVRGRILEIQIRSVNHRHLDVRIRLPLRMAALEPKVRERVSQALDRGSVDVNVLEAEGASEARIRADLTAARSYMRALRSLADAFPGEAPGWRDLIAFREIFAAGDASGSPEAAWPALEKGLGRALASLERMRKREGAALKRFLLRLIGNTERLARRIAGYAARRAPRYRERLRDRIAKAVRDLDEARLYQEVVLFADRSDITEELDRLNSHIAYFRRLAHGAEPVGRKLDFLIQEMNREANTIASKANDVDISHAVVEIKSILEKLREQVQNTE